MILSAVITEAGEGGFIAFNPETGTTTQGETNREAVNNLREATSLFLEEFPEIQIPLRDIPAKKISSWDQDEIEMREFLAANLGILP